MDKLVQDPVTVQTQDGECIPETSGGGLYPALPDVTVCRETRGIDLATAAGLPTCCDLDRTNNVWLEGAYPVTACCMLDNITVASIIDILSRDPRARQDLSKVTSVTYLRWLAENTTPLNPVAEESDVIQKELNAIGGAGPFYSQFHGLLP